MPRHVDALKQMEIVFFVALYRVQKSPTSENIYKKGKVQSGFEL